MRRGKEKNWRIARRLTAFLLCLAMVLGVIYIDGKKKEIEAAPGDGIVEITGFTDENYLTDVGFDFTSAAAFTLNVPTDQVTFTLPAVDKEDGFTYAWYAAGTEPAPDSTDSWILVNGDQNITALTSTVGTAVLYRIKEGKEPIADDPATTEIDETQVQEDAVAEKVSELEYKLTDITELSVSADDATSMIVVSGSEAYASEDTSPNMYYGVVQMAYEKSEGDPKESAADVTGWTSQDDVLDAVNADGKDADGSYIIYKKVELKDGSNTVAFFQAGKVERNFIIDISSVTIASNTKSGTVVDTADARSMSITGVKPSEDVVITFTFGEGEAATAKATLDSTDYDSVDGVITIPKSALNEGLSRTGKVVVSASGKRSVTYDPLEVSYLTATPAVSITDVAGADSKTLSGGKYYLNEKDTTAAVSANITTSDASVFVSGAVLYDGADAEIASNTLDGTENDVTTTLEFTPSVPGETTYYVKGLTTGDGSKKSEPISIFYDPDAPLISNITANQAGKNISISDDALTEKITCGKALVLTFEAADVTGDGESGLASTNPVTVTCDGASGSLIISGSTCTYTVPAAASLQGKTISIGIKVVDLAGNETTKTISASYYEEKMGITHELVPSVPEDGITKENSITVNYTIKSDAAIDHLTLTYTKNTDAATSETIPASDLTTDGTRDTDGMLTYTWQRSISVTESTDYKDIILKAVNVNGYTSEADTISFIRIDMTNPSWQDDLSVDSDWYRELVLTIIYKDEAEGGYVSGVDENSLQDLTGAQLGSYKKNISGTYTRTLIVNPSENAEGTPVSFVIRDKAGNESATFSKTFYVDSEKPYIQAIWVKNRQKVWDNPLSGDPKITYNASDNIEIVKEEMQIIYSEDPIDDITDPAQTLYATVYNVNPALLGPSISNVPLSKLIGVNSNELKDGWYYISLWVYDPARIQSTLLSDGPTRKDAPGFRLDNEAPVVGMEIQPDYRKLRKNVATYSKTGLPFVLNYQYDKYIGEKTIKIDLYTNSDAINNVVLKVDYRATSEAEEAQTAEIVKTLSEWKPYSGDIYRATLTVGGKDGMYTVNFRTLDDAMEPNMSEQDSLSFLLDTDDPDIDLKVNGQPYEKSGVFYSTDAAVYFEAKDNNADDNGYSVTVKSTPAGGSASTYGPDNTLKNKETRSYGSSASYEITYKATDFAGNTATRTIQFIVDKDRPMGDVLIQNPENAAKFASHNMSYSNAESGKQYKYARYFNHSVTATLQISEYYPTGAVVKDNGEQVLTFSDFTTSGKISTATYTASKEGLHTITIEATDKAGNASTLQQVSFVIDTTKPLIGLKVNGEEYTEAGKFYAADVAVDYSVTDSYKDLNDNTVTVTETPAGGSALAPVVDSTLKEERRTYGNDSVYVLTYETVDLAGNKNSRTISFIVDKTKPLVDVLIQNPGNAAKFDEYHNSYNNAASGNHYNYAKYYNHAVSMTLQIAEYYPVSATVKDNGKEVLTFSSFNTSGRLSTAQYTTSEEGEHVITIEATDKAGNPAILQKAAFVIDTTDPVIGIKTDGTVYTTDGKYYPKDVPVEYTVTDTNKDVNDNTIIIRETPSGGTALAPVTDATLKEGVRTFGNNALYVLTYEAVDLAGNKATKTITFIVDKVDPLADIIIQNPTNAAKYSTYNLEYSNGASGEKYSYAQYYNHDVTMTLRVVDFYPGTITVSDNGTVVRRLDGFTAAGKDYTASYTTGSEGEHNISIDAIDLSGNVAKTSAVRFIIDKTAPSVSTTLNGNTFSEGAATQYLGVNAIVGVTVSDSNEDEGDLNRTREMTIPGGGTSSITTKITEGNDTYSDEADYKITYKAVDRAGNESPSRSVTFRVDKTAPALDITSAVEGGFSAEAVEVSYNMIEAFFSDMPSAVVKIYRKLDGTTESLVKTVDIRAAGQNTIQKETFEEDGAYRFDFDAVDRAGNPGHATYSFTMDATAPTVVLSGVKNYDKTKDKVELEVLVTESFYTGNTVTVDGIKTDIDRKENRLEPQPYEVNENRESTVKQVYTDDGIYDITISSKDKAGNETVQPVHFTIDNTAPVIGDLSKYDGVRLNKFVWDLDESELVKDLTACNITIYLDGTAYDGVTDLADGTHVLRVHAVDELGNEASKEVSFILDQIAPNIIVSGIENQQRIEEAVNISVSLQIDEDHLDSVTLNGAAQTINGNKASFKVDSVGSYNLVVKAHDDAGNESTLDWTFTYGGNFPWWIIIVAVCALLLILLIIMIVRQKSWKQKK